MTISDLQRQADLARNLKSAFRPVWQCDDMPFRSFDHARTENCNDTPPAANEADDWAEQLEDSYRKGFAEGQAVVAEANADLLAASERLAQAAASLKAQPGDAMAETLLVTVRQLIEQTAGFAQPDTQMLERNCRALAVIAAKECTDAVLHIHPDDRALLNEADVGVTLQDDYSLMRGTLSLAHAEGWIEQGTKSMLDELDSMIEAMRSAR